MSATTRKADVMCVGLALVLTLLVGCGGPSNVATPSGVPTSETPTSDSEFVALRVIVNVPAEVILTWKDTGGRFQVGPLTDYVIPLPADGAVVGVEVTAKGYLGYTTVITASQPQTITVELVPATLG